MKKDYSQQCSMDDDNEPLCWECKYFVFPIGCMIGEDVEDEKSDSCRQS